MSSDLTFITNETGKTLRDRFSVLLSDDTRFFDCLVGYFFINGFYKLYSSLENVEKIRILVGLKTDRTAYELLQMATDVYYITPKGPSVSLKYVLALLNSRLYFLWLYFKGKRKGEMLELYLKPLSEIPIKRISPDEQKPFIKLVDRILAAKQRGAEADTSALEQEIDRLVYDLYGLTKEEIAIVERKG